MPRIGLAHGHRIRQIDASLLDGGTLPGVDFFRCRSLPLVEALLIPPLAQIQIEFGNPCCRQQPMGRALGAGLNHQTQVRQRLQGEHHLSQAAAVDIGEDDDGAAGVTRQRRHEIPCGSGRNPELLGNRPHGAPHTGPRTRNNGMDRTLLHGAMP
ncbi:hypothetical protein [Streptomyces sp. NRRL B-1381]|uniref:hypothetical protein n=1 Tax=Streptomyces sp. NRRL B-1381 TaxID=1463829 RepID=UPI00131C311F|nr:hypothetical protein [Streptomyces sp. NRRL B-1381]